MKIKTVSYRRGRTVNVGNYSSERAEVEITIELGEDDNYDSKMAKLKEEVNRQLTRELSAGRSK